MDGWKDSTVDRVTGIVSQGKGIIGKKKMRLLASKPTAGKQ
jgi:hypothetical protein